MPQSFTRANIYVCAAYIRRRMTDEKVTFEFIEQNESNSAEAEEILESPAEVSKKETGSSSKSAAKTKKRKKTALDYAIELLIKIVITVAVVLILCIFVIGIHVNHGNSNYPMIKDGDLVITFKPGTMNTGDEIYYKVNGEVRYGRIIAKAGDEITINDTYVMVNGFGLSEDVIYPTTADGALISFPYVVQEGTVFVLNDFRKDVKDSRTYGAIPLGDCEGKIVLVIRRRGI